MIWKRISIGKCCEVTSSKRIFLSEYVDQGIPFYRSKEIIESRNGQDITEPLFISKQRYESIKNEYGVPVSGDMLLTSVGTIGVPYIVKPSDQFYFKDGNLIWFRNFSANLDSRYLSYWISSHEGLGMLNGVAIGSSQKALTIAALKDLKIPLPPIEVQKRIVSIISAYDDFIENNRLQIKLLEEAAQRLYKEWFIDLRFPGWETTPIVDGLPEGWTNGNLGQLAAFSRGKTITKANITAGFIPVVAGGLEPAYHHSVSNTKAPVVTISASGANAGYVRMYHEPVWASDCSFVDITTTEWLHLAYCFLKACTEEIRNLQRGAAQPHVYPKDINSLEVAIPGKVLCKSFEYLTSNVFRTIGLLEKQIDLLSSARDALLSRLMSGEMEVKYD